MPLHLIFTIIVIGLLVTLVTDALPLQPVFKRLIYLVAAVYLLLVIFGAFGGNVDVVR